MPPHPLVHHIPIILIKYSAHRKTEHACLWKAAGKRPAWKVILDQFLVSLKYQQLGQRMEGKWDYKGKGTGLHKKLQWQSHIKHQNYALLGTSLVVQWLRLCVPNAGKRVTARKARGPQVEEIGCKCQMFFFLFSLNQQEKTTHKCQIFFPLFYTKLKGGLFYNFVLLWQYLVPPELDFSQTLT